MRFCEFRKKEVISIKDCKRLGHVCDMEFDECKGCIQKIMVPGYCCIRQIGPDIILVDI